MSERAVLELPVAEAVGLVVDMAGGVVPVRQAVKAVVTIVAGAAVPVRPVPAAVVEVAAAGAAGPVAAMEVAVAVAGARPVMLARCRRERRRRRRWRMRRRRIPVRPAATRSKIIKHDRDDDCDDSSLADARWRARALCANEVTDWFPCGEVNKRFSTAASR
jgi:hypothetical protein